MRHLRGVGRGGQVLLAGVMAACLLAGAPAANAVFTRTVDAGTVSVGTYALPAPTGNTVPVAMCTQKGHSGKYTLDITVTSHGTVPKATGYVLRIWDGNGLLQDSKPLNPGYVYSTATAAKGWGYTIDAQYTVPTRQTNIWSSSATPVTLCN